MRGGLPNQNDPNLKPLGSVEQISFGFAKIQWTYFLSDGTPIKGGFDVNGNQSF
ncbi:MAG: type VI secretion system tube protein Hcp [Acidobacteria bacterium]|nr:type VI secretion system tube protein Hcp [Acidobacteriota bacterium]